MKLEILCCQLLYKPSVDISPVVIEVDRDRIIQVLSNLLNNALNSSNQRMIRDNEKIFPVEVSMNRDDTSEEIVIMVSDNGTGIDKSITEKLFTKFATTSDGGTGLGLYISKNLVEGHGGRIWAYNKATALGATFCFTLPFNPKSLSSLFRNVNSLIGIKYELVLWLVITQAQQFFR